VPAAGAKRNRRFAWSDADLQLIDEMAAHCRAIDVSYGHAMVDEAQDLSAMQAHVIARRCRRGWSDRAGRRRPGDPARRRDGRLVGGAAGPPAPGAEVLQETLTMTYRVPAEILELARPVAAVAAPWATVPTSIREGGEVVVGEPVPDLRATLAEALAGFEEVGGLVGVIVARSGLADVRSMLETGGMAFAEAPAVAGGADVYLVPADLAKGLEFDHAIVVEPRSIVDDYDRGEATLFVALTRATRSLTIVRRRELPVVLGDPAVEEDPQPPLPFGPDPRLLALQAEVDGLLAERDQLLTLLAELEAVRRDRDALSQRVSMLEGDRRQLHAELTQVAAQLADLAVVDRERSVSAA
jgi:hypothetical protein